MLLPAENMAASVGNASPDRCRLVNRRAMTKFTKPENLEHDGYKESLGQLWD